MDSQQRINIDLRYPPKRLQKNSNTHLKQHINKTTLLIKIKTGSFPPRQKSLPPLVHPIRHVRDVANRRAQ